jgi:hypothetical protein
LENAQGTPTPDPLGSHQNSFAGGSIPFFLANGRTNKPNPIKTMQIRFKKLRLAPAALAAAAALSLSSASADTVLTGYAAGDVFIGFRQTGVTNTVVFNLGSVTKFLPASLGGTWNGSAFNITFGVIPNTSTVVNDISADLIATFGSDWADNFVDGTGVRWAVVGITDNAADNVPINGFNARTAFVTKARTNPGTQSATLASVNLDNFGLAFNSFAVATGGGSYINQFSTTNSSVAFIGDGSLANNWNAKIGANGAFGLGSGRVVEQLNSGTFQGTTNSVLDFYVAPFSGSTLTTSRTYTGGSFSLNSAGELTYGVVPEPGSAAFVGVGAVLFLGMTRRRNHSTASLT